MNRNCVFEAMWNRAFSFLLLLSIFCGLHASDFQRRFLKRNAVESRKFVQEKECSKAGGICLDRGDCPTDKISAYGKCSTQSEAGAVCCHSLSVNEKKCNNLGGACMDRCHENVKLSQAQDCPASQFCCALVN